MALQLLACQGAHISVELLNNILGSDIPNARIEPVVVAFQEKSNEIICSSSDVNTSVYTVFTDCLRKNRRPKHTISDQYHNILGLVSKGRVYNIF
jgi:hypothetical protein